jgi:hypothetical protein
MGDATIDGHRMWAALTASLRSLFDPAVRGEPGPTLADLEDAMPEVEPVSPTEVLAPDPPERLAAVT